MSPSGTAEPSESARERHVLLGVELRHDLLLAQSGTACCRVHRVRPGKRPSRQVAGPPARPVRSAVEITVVDHPLVAHKLTVLRDANTDSPTFRRLTEELVTLLAYEATREVRVDRALGPDPGRVRRPAFRSPGPRPLVVPILRAGLGMLEGMTRLIPTAEVGFVGMVRDEETLQASTYAERLPDDLSGRQCYVLDPMLATGGTLAAAVRFLVKRGADQITCICLLAAPEGIERDHRAAGRPPRALHCWSSPAVDDQPERVGLHRPRARRRRRPAVRRGGLIGPSAHSTGPCRHTVRSAARPS